MKYDFFFYRKAISLNKFFFFFGNQRYKNTFDKTIIELFDYEW